MKFNRGGSGGEGHLDIDVKIVTLLLPLVITSGKQESCDAESFIRGNSGPEGNFLKHLSL